MQSTIRRKHALVIALLVCGSLVVLGGTDMYFAYAQAKLQVGRAQSAQAAELAGSIRAALGLVERQLAAVTVLPWHGTGWLGMQDRRAEYVRLLRIAPSVESVSYLGASGELLLNVSRREVDWATEPGGTAGTGAPARSPLNCEYSRVEYANDYEPFVTLQLSSNEQPQGRTVAHVNLRALADEVSRSLAVPASEALVVDDGGHVVLHKNPSLMLERRHVGDLPHVAEAMRHEIAGLPGRGPTGERLIASSSDLPRLGWHAIVEQDRSTALAPVTAAFVRTGGFLLAGMLLSIGGAYYLASRLTQPILALHRGAIRLSEGDFDASLDVRTGDELEQLGNQFNRMSKSLRESYETLEQKVLEKTHALEIANRHKSEFLANMSHELRTPLMGILGFAQVLQMEMRGTLNARQHEHVADILSSGEHLLALIKDVLDLAKIEAGRLQLELAPFSVGNAITQSLRLVRERCEQKGIALTTDIGSDVGTWIADERRFRQIVLNLLGNAAKFTPAGGSIAVTARREPDAGLSVSVSDTGRGIASSDMGLVFEAFRQVGDDEVLKAEGTGLGLALVRRLVEAQGGRVDIASTVGQGTTVTFNLPGPPP